VVEDHVHVENYVEAVKIKINFGEKETLFLRRAAYCALIHYYYWVLDFYTALHNGYAMIGEEFKNQILHQSGFSNQDVVFSLEYTPRMSLILPSTSSN
jgi:hypothetical protein